MVENIQALEILFNSITQNIVSNTRTSKYVEIDHLGTLFSLIWNSEL